MLEAGAARERPVIRVASERDVAGICRFGESHVADHYAPLIGAGPARAQVERWWNETQIRAAVAAGLVVVADERGAIVGVGQRGRSGADHTIDKLYVHPDWRGSGIGPLLVDSLVGQLPADAERVQVEHFAGNDRAGAFYEREGFAVERVEPGPTDALAVVWRARPLRPSGRAPTSRRGGPPARRGDEGA